MHYPRLHKFCILYMYVFLISNVQFLIMTSFYFAEFLSDWKFGSIFNTPILKQTFPCTITNNSAYRTWIPFSKACPDTLLVFGQVILEKLICDKSQQMIRKPHSNFPSRWGKNEWSTGKSSSLFYFCPCCQWVNLRLDESVFFSYLSLNTPVSGQI